MGSHRLPGVRDAPWGAVWDPITSSTPPRAATSSSTYLLELPDERSIDGLFLLPCLPTCSAAGTIFICTRIILQRLWSAMAVCCKGMSWCMVPCTRPRSVLLLGHNGSSLVDKDTETLWESPVWSLLGDR